MPLVVAAVVAAAAAVVVTAGGSGAVTDSASGFESADGNMALDATTTGTNTDWNCFVGSDNFRSGTPNPKCKVTTGASQLTADASGETEWVNGQKFDTQCPLLSTGNNPPKDEFVNVASYTDSAANNDVYFYGATIRSTANGNASGDVEFNQSSGDDTTTAGCRTAGDRMLAYDYLNGGTSLDFHVLTWIDSSHSTLGGNNGTCLVKTDNMPCWGAHVTDVDASFFDGESNQSAISATNNGISGAALAINQFAEFGFNLTKGLDLTGCINFPQQVWESRSSGSSFTSNPQDIEIQHQTIQTCGEIKIIKQTDPRGQDQAFSFTSNLPAQSTAGGVVCTGKSTAGIQSDGSFCLNDTGNAGKTLGSTTTANNSAGNTVHATDVPQGSYTVTEGALPGAFSFESLTCTADGTSGSSVTPSSSTSVKTASITLKPSGLVTCVFVNQLHSGAILISKTAKDKRCLGAGDPTIANGVCTGAGTAKLGGASFKITTDQAGTQAVTGSPKTTANSTGTACIDGLSWSGAGTTYYVTETAAPTGYALDDGTAQAVTVTQNAKCSDSNIASVAALKSFSDSPLTDLTVTVSSEVAGASNSSITCVDSGNKNIGNSPRPSSGLGDPETMTADPTHGGALKPGTYTCTVVIDP